MKYEIIKDMYDALSQDEVKRVPAVKRLFKLTKKYFALSKDMSKKNKKKYEKWEKSIKETIYELDLNVSPSAFENLDGYWILFHVLKELESKRNEILDKHNENQ